MVEKIDKPYYINELCNIDNPTRLKLVKNHWPINNEHLWIGKIDINLFYIEGVRHFYPLVDSFFKRKGYEFDIETIDVNKGVEADIEQVCKAVYLTDQYLKSKSFRDPICSHYNPRWGEHVIHPGGTRQVILELFHTGKVKTFYFNTNGFNFNFLDQMEKVNIDKFFLDDEYNKALVPDHGTLIPHILRLSGVEALPTAMISCHNRYKQKFADPEYRIYSVNRRGHIAKLDWIEPWATFKSNTASTTVVFNNDIPAEKVKLKAILLILGGIDYEDNELSVRHKN